MGGAEGAQGAHHRDHGGGVHVDLQQLLHQLADGPGLHRRGQRLRGTVQLGVKSRRVLQTRPRRPPRRNVRVNLGLENLVILSLIANLPLRG